MQEVEPEVDALKDQIDDLREDLEKTERRAEAAEQVAAEAEDALDSAQHEARVAIERLSGLLDLFADFERGIRDLDEVRAKVRELGWW